MTTLALAALATLSTFLSLQTPPTTAPSTQPTAATPATPAAPAGQADSMWTLPAGWTQEPGERPMRVATFRAMGVEISVSQFPGNVGGLLANVNRWRGQVGLPPITEAQLPQETPPFKTPGFAGYSMRLKGPKMHLLGASLAEEAAGRTWFVKAIATPDEADKLEGSFLEFVKSFKAGR